MIPTLPLHPRNRLAGAILAALGDEAARVFLAALASGQRDPLAWLDASPGGERRAAAEETAARVRERARRACQAMAGLGLPRDGGLHGALEAAAALFDAGLGFEVHELLEPHWVRAGGEEREALQGLIQVAVGYQHLANGNLAGAGSLLAEGAVRLERGRLDGYDLREFSVAIRETIPALASGAARIPPFPRRAG